MIAGNPLHEIVQRLGGHLYAGGTQAVVPGPGHSRADRSLSLRLGNGGRVIWHSFAGDAAPAVVDHLGVERSAQATPAERREAARQREAAARARAEADRAFCVAAWAGTVPIEGTPAEAYLWSRGLILEGCAEIRFHPAMPRSKEPKGIAPLPAMVARLRTVAGESRALHATYLTPDGRKALGDRSRLMFGPARQCAVQLAPPTGDGVLGVAEGIETAGAYSTLKGVPTWATLSTSGLQGFEVPKGVRRLVIAADSDDKTGAGIETAKRLAERACRVCDVVIDAAPTGFDWGDVLEGRTHG